MVAQARRLLPDTVLMGGVETEDLQFRSAAEVRALTAQAIRQGGRAGRFILIPRHVPVSSPLDAAEEENFITFLRAAHEEGKYSF